MSSLLFTIYSFGSSITLRGSSSVLELLETIGNSDDYVLMVELIQFEYRSFFGTPQNPPELLVGIIWQILLFGAFPAQFLEIVSIDKGFNTLVTFFFFSW